MIVDVMRMQAREMLPNTNSQGGYTQGLTPKVD